MFILLIGLDGTLYANSQGKQTIVRVRGRGYELMGLVLWDNKNSNIKIVKYRGFVMLSQS